MFPIKIKGHGKYDERDDDGRREKPSKRSVDDGRDEDEEAEMDEMPPMKAKRRPPVRSAPAHDAPLGVKALASLANRMSQLVSDSDVEFGDSVLLVVMSPGATKSKPKMGVAGDHEMEGCDD